MYRLEASRVPLVPLSIVSLSSKLRLRLLELELDEVLDDDLELLEDLEDLDDREPDSSYEAPNESSSRAIVTLGGFLTTGFFS